MAAGYRTARPVFVDNKMMQMPWELMASVIEKQDAEIDLSMGQASGINDMLKMQSLPGDKNRADEILAGYEDEVYNLTETIRRDPLNHQKQLHKIRNLSKNINQNMANGEWAALQGRYDGYTADSKRVNELEAKDGYTDDYKRRLINKQLKDAGKADYQEDGSFNRYQNAEALAMGNMNEWVDERLKDAIPDAQSIETDTVNGGWIITTKEGTERMTEEELDGILNDSFMGDTGLQNAIRQRGELGMDGFTGLTDADGNFGQFSGLQNIKVTGTDGKEVEVPQLAFANNMVGKAFRAGVTKFGFTESSYSRTRKADPYSMATHNSNLIEARQRNKEERDTDYAQLVNNESISSFAPSTLAGYNQEVNSTSNIMIATKAKAKEQVKNILGSVSESVAQAIDNGDFDILEGTVPESTIAKYKNDYKRALIKQSTLAGAEKTWIAEMKKAYDDENFVGGMLPALDNATKFNKYLEENRAQFNVFLNENNNVITPTSYTFEGTGMNQKEIESFQESVVDGQLYLDAKFEYNGTETTLNNLIRSGTVLPTQEKVGVNTKNVDTTGMNAAQKLVAESDSKKIQYAFVDGSGYINFDVSSKSILPSTSLNDDNQIDIMMNATISGKPVPAKISSEVLTSNGIEAFKNVNASDLQFNLDIAKMSSYNNIEFPHSPGTKLNAKDGEIILNSGQVLQLKSTEGRVAGKMLLLY